MLAKKKEEVVEPLQKYPKVFVQRLDKLFIRTLLGNWQWGGGGKRTAADKNDQFIKWFPIRPEV